MQLEFTTPMMQQYQRIKEQYKDCLLFFRMGDFYELFLEDAHTGSKVLDITLTSRAKGKDGRIPMAGVPFHAVDSYITKLVKAGHKVAICEQMSEPQKYGIVDREVIRIVTPGTVIDEKALSQKENNYLISLVKTEEGIGLAAADISTGRFQINQYKASSLQTEVMNEIVRLSPAECVLAKDFYDSPKILQFLKQQPEMNIYCFQDWDRYTTNAQKMLTTQFGLKAVTLLSVENKKEALQAGAGLLGYLRYTQKDKIEHITKLGMLGSQDYMSLDRSTIVNLELFSTLRDHDPRGSFIHILDKTLTPMGGRMLREWVRKPLINLEKIVDRHEVVSLFVAQRKDQKEVRDTLQEIGDVERILSRLSIGVGNARDLLHLMHSLMQTMHIKKIINTETTLLKEVKNMIDSDIEKVIMLIKANIADEPPIDLKIGGLLRSGVSEELDALRKEVGINKDWVRSMEATERERTGITSLKIRFNEVFGFYIEISKSNIHLAPKNYIRKQTLVNGERFITPELKEKEEKILTAEERIKDLEYELFSKILLNVLEYTRQIQQAAEAIAILDCLSTFAVLANTYNYTRPSMIKKGNIQIVNGRHPVVEQVLQETQFVPNTVQLDDKKNQLLIITGPNMAGKSVFVRQIAMLLLMAQIGSFIPVEKADLAVVDRVFVRSGAADVITAGLSTFMVEMVETAHILDNATSSSFIVMDEIGRGTSTYDGISIAWAIAEYLVKHKKVQPKTLFATHYHELQQLEEIYPEKISNYHMAVEEHNNKPIFLHTLKVGGASHSFGVAVAKLAGLPEEVIRTASKKLLALESTEVTESSPHKKNNLNSLLKKVDVMNTTPLEALKLLQVLKTEAESYE